MKPENKNKPRDRDKNRDRDIIFNIEETIQECSCGELALSFKECSSQGEVNEISLGIFYLCPHCKGVFDNDGIYLNQQDKTFNGVY